MSPTKNNNGEAMNDPYRSSDATVDNESNQLNFRDLQKNLWVDSGSGSFPIV